MIEKKDIKYFTGEVNLLKENDIKNIEEEHLEELARTIQKSIIEKHSVMIQYATSITKEESLRAPKLYRFVTNQLQHDRAKLTIISHEVDRYKSRIGIDNANELKIVLEMILITVNNLSVAVYQD